MMEGFWSRKKSPQEGPKISYITSHQPMTSKWHVVFFKISVASSSWSSVHHNHALLISYIKTCCLIYNKKVGQLRQVDKCIVCANEEQEDIFSVRH